jgi:hypothetical protein
VSAAVPHRLARELRPPAGCAGSIDAGDHVATCTVAPSWARTVMTPAPGAGFDTGLVGLQLEQRFVGGDGLAVQLDPADDHAFEIDSPRVGI